MESQSVQNEKRGYTERKNLGYLQFLKENVPYRNLFIAYSVSVLGEWFTTIALLGWIYAETQSGFMVSLLLISGALPRLILGPLAGVFIDRLHKKQVLIITDICRALLVIGFIFATEQVWLVIALHAIISMIGVCYAPARQSIIPAIVPAHQLLTANALTSTVWGLMGIVGASLGGVVTALISYESSFIINSICFLISVVFVYKCRIHKQQTLKQPQINSSILLEFTESIQFVRRQPVVMAVILVGIGWGFVGGSFQVLLPIYGTDVFQSGEFGIGILYAVQGISIICGGWIVAKWFGYNLYRMKQVFGWAYFIQGFFFILFCLTTNLWLGMILLFCMRLGGGIIIPIDTTLLQTYVNKEMMGRVFSLHMSTYGAFTQLSMFCTGLLLEWYHPHFVGILFGILCILISFSWLFLLYNHKLSDKRQVNAV